MSAITEIKGKYTQDEYLESDLCRMMQIIPGY